jgi:catechol 2,3-dioxygenase-like lactoylglutathione lyase family enzyme
VKSSKPLLLLAAFVGLVAAGRAAEARRPKVTGLAHAAFFVSDMNKAVAFYTEFLGFATPYSLPMPSGGELVWIKINERQSIELFPPSAAAGTDRLSHIAFETEDADAMRLYLKSKGIAVPETTPVGKSGNKNFTISDPDGNRVEIVEYLPTSWTAREKGKFLPESRISTRMPHVGIKVGRLDPAMAFYRDLFGLKEIYRQSADGNTLSWVNLQVPDGEDYIEFMLYDRPPSATQLLTMHHVCLEVDDIMATHRQLASRTLPPGCQAPTGMKLGKNGRWQINCYDPDGSRVEVMEPNTYNGEKIAPSHAPPPHGDSAPL